MLNIKDAWNKVGKNSLIDAAINLGKSAAHALSPDDFEYYLCSLELLDSKLERIGFLSFTVMPDQIVESSTPIQTLMKTNKAIVTTFTDSFSPKNISLSGTFGRKFRIVTNFKKPISKFSLDFNIGSYGGIGIKSGYGLIKILSDILEESNNIDQYANPQILIFRNYALGTEYVVNVQNFQFHQGVENNMLWYYNINLVAVGYPRNNVLKNSLEFLGRVAAGGLANSLNSMITKMINF